MRVARPLGSGSVEWIDRDGWPWQVDVRWAEIEGRAEAVALTLRSCGEVAGELVELRRGAGVRPLTASMFKAFPLARVVAAARRSVQDFLEMRDLDDKWLSKNARAELAKAMAAPAPPRGGPRGLSAEELEKVARVYTKARDERKPPTQAVRKEFVLSQSAAESRVRRARAVGLLPPTVQGRAKSAPVKRSRKQTRKRGS